MSPCPLCEADAFPVEAAFAHQELAYMPDSWLKTEHEYVRREAAGIEAIKLLFGPIPECPSCGAKHLGNCDTPQYVPENESYAALTAHRLNHLNDELERRVKLKQYKPDYRDAIKPEVLLEIKHRLPLDRFLGQFLTLRKEGHNLVARCPYHEEKTPSFTVYTDHFFCFGCNVRGDIFDWLMRDASRTFAEAVQVAANLAGIDLRPLPRVQADERSLLT